MKTKIKKLKTNIDRHLSTLSKSHPMSKLLSSAIESYLAKDVDDELLKVWYGSLRKFIRDIEKEIEILDKKVYTYENICKFKDHMDKHYKVLDERHHIFFITLYTYVEYILEDGELNKYQKESYINIYNSVQIIQEEIDRIEKSFDHSEKKNIG